MQDKHLENAKNRSPKDECVVVGGGEHNFENCLQIQGKYEID